MNKALQTEEIKNWIDDKVKQKLEKSIDNFMDTLLPNYEREIEKILE
ncbi:MAG: hypothetical protein FWE13_04735 [Firmicutes bacterium]|nr:hypothetical protein [Bacillota bacterium]